MFLSFFSSFIATHSSFERFLFGAFCKLGKCKLLRESTQFFNSILLSKGVGVNLKHLCRSITCCWDNNLCDKFNHSINRDRIKCKTQTNKQTRRLLRFYLIWIKHRILLIICINVIESAELRTLHALGTTRLTHHYLRLSTYTPYALYSHQ